MKLPCSLLMWTMHRAPDALPSLSMQRLGQPQAPDGTCTLAAELTTYKTVRVSRRQCTRYAQRLGLGPCIRTAFGFRRSDGRPGPEDSMLAEAFEAVLGAMYQVQSRSGVGSAPGLFQL